MPRGSGTRKEQMDREFFRTEMGRQLRDRPIPALVAAVNRLAGAIEKQATPDTDCSAAYVRGTLEVIIDQLACACPHGPEGADSSCLVCQARQSARRALTRFS